MIKWLRRIFNEYPDPADYSEEGLEFQYTAQAIYPDVVRVFFNGRALFQYYWINGMDAPLHSRLRAWHKLFEEHQNA